VQLFLAFVVVLSITAALIPVLAHWAPSIGLTDAPDFRRRDLPGAARDIFHHMGTTRMSRTPQSGVTNTNLRCHDVDNLYIAGSSVFPTGGIANPTALARTI